MKRLLFCGLLLIGGTSFATKDSIKIAAALDDCHLEKSVPAAAVIIPILIKVLWP